VKVIGALIVSVSGPRVVIGKSVTINPGLALRSMRFFRQSELTVRREALQRSR
jgi:hypothetical protein